MNENRWGGQPLQSSYGEVTAGRSGIPSATTAAYNGGAIAGNRILPSIDPRLLAEEARPSFQQQQPGIVEPQFYAQIGSQSLHEGYNFPMQVSLNAALTKAVPQPHFWTPMIPPSTESWGAKSTKILVPSNNPIHIDHHMHRSQVVGESPRINKSRTPKQPPPPIHNPYAHWPGGKWTYTASQYFTPRSPPEETRTQSPKVNGDAENPKVRPVLKLCERLKKKLVEDGVGLEHPGGHKSASSDKNTNSKVAGNLAFCNRSVPLTTHPDECIPEAPEPQRERACGLTALDVLQYPPALDQQKKDNQVKWLDKCGHSRNTIFVVTHQIGSDLRDMRIFDRLEKANTDALSLMQKQHPELFAIPLTSEGTENQPQSSVGPITPDGLMKKSTASGRAILDATQLSPRNSNGSLNLEKLQQINIATSSKHKAAGQKKADGKAETDQEVGSDSIERHYVYTGEWKFTAMCTLKLSAKLPNGQMVRISSSLKNPRSSPPPKRERKEAAKKAKAAVDRPPKASTGTKRKQIPGTTSRSISRSKVTSAQGDVKKLRVNAGSTPDESETMRVCKKKKR